MSSLPLPSNTELLQRFHAARSSEAFAELVSRFSGFVLATARRHTAGDWHAAEDIAQTVFTALAQQAKQVRGETLGAWLYGRTVFVASNLRRQDQKRALRERAVAAEVQDVTEPPRLPDGFDEAFSKLPMEDQQALLSRYVEEMDFRTIGDRLGISEGAAQKRTSRALEALRGMLSKRGVVYGASALSAAMEAAGAQVTVHAALQARWCEGALRSAKAASWSLVGIAVPAMCLVMGASIPLAMKRSADPLNHQAIESFAAADANVGKSANLPAAPPAIVDLAALVELAKKGQDSPLWMARMDRTVNGLSGMECATLMAGLGYRQDTSGSRPPEIIREKVAKRWCEVDPREAAVRLNLSERGTAYRIIGAENLAEAERMIAALPQEDAKVEFRGYKSVQNTLWCAALCGLARKDLAAALEQMDAGAERLGLEYRDSLKRSVIQDAATSNPEQTVRMLGKMEDQDYLAQALRNLAKSKARLAWDLLETFPVSTGERPGVEQEIFAALLKQDAKEAIRLAPSILGARVTKEASSIARVLYQDGFESAWAIAEKSKPAEFSEALQGQLRDLFAVEKPAEAMAKFSSRDANPAVRQVWWSAFTNLAERDPAAALAFKMDSSAPPSNKLQSVAYNMAQKDTDAALQWLADLPDSFKEEAAKCITQISGMNHTQDPKIRAQSLMAKPDARSRCLELTPTLKQWYKNDPVEAQQFAESLTGEERASAFCGLLQGASPAVVGGLEVAKPILSELAKSNPPMNDNAIYAVTQFVQTWVKEEPDAASEWINALPRGRVFDHAARGIAEGLRLSDPRDALTWVTAIADAKLRDGMASWILQDWSMADSDDARAAVEELSVPPQVKAAFLKSIRPTQ